MSSGELSYKYARALFLAARDADQTESLVSRMDALEEALTADLGIFLTAPQITRKRKMTALNDWLNELFADQDNALLLRFFDLILIKGRAVVLSEVPHWLRLFNDEAKGLERGQVVVARSLPDSDHRQIEEKISHWRGRKVQLEQVVDEEVLGGFRVTLGSTQIDASLSGRYDRLKESLLATSKQS